MSWDWRGELIEKALLAREHAYAPYSHIYVGAALLCANNEMLGGFNIENAALTPGICAERVAFARALYAGEREFKAIAVVGGPKDMDAATTGYFYPCGVCRQWMAEFCGPDFIVLAAISAGDFQEISLAELLPHSFGPGHMKLPQ
ncbi:MAG: cytidine deaminase [Clostridiales bacterium]|nr:cytidine deaminase [Clostridiales bacterium]